MASHGPPGRQVPCVKCGTERLWKVPRVRDTRGNTMSTCAFIVQTKDKVMGKLPHAGRPPAGRNVAPSSSPLSASEQRRSQPRASLFPASLHPFNHAQRDSGVGFPLPFTGYHTHTQPHSGHYSSIEKIWGLPSTLHPASPRVILPLSNTATCVLAG